MKKIRIRLICHAVIGLLGIVLFILAVCAELDSFFAGLGGGLIGVCGIKIIQIVRYLRDTEYAKKIEIECRDERNIFLAQKARSSAFAVGLVINAAMSIALRIAGYNEFSTICGYIVCFFLVLYLIFYLVYGKKN